MRFLLLTVIFFVSPMASAHRVGNGGDHIRATFIKVGRSVVEYLQQTEAGAKLAAQHELNPTTLEASLDIEKVSVTDELLRDNSGSVVEAIGSPGSIRLQKEAWFKHFESQRDITYLVFHEMLRSAGMNDDNYVISAALNPFPFSLRVATKIVPTLPLIEEDNLATIFHLAKVSVAGSGCPADQRGTVIEFDEEKNLLLIQLAAYRVDIWQGNNLARKACAMTLPVKLPKGKRLVISQIDLLGKVDLQAGSTSQLQFEAFLAGTTNPKKTRTIAPAERLHGRTLTRRTEVLRSRCGEADNLRLNSSLMARGSDRGIESAQVDELSLYLTLENCKP